MSIAIVDIPEDVWDAARSLRSAVLWESNSSVHHIARALLAQRLASQARVEALTADVERKDAALKAMLSNPDKASRAQARAALSDRNGEGRDDPTSGHGSQS